MTERRLRSLIAQWQGRLGLDQWRLTVQLVDELQVNGCRALMAVRRHHHYDRATLQISAAVFDIAKLPRSIERDLIEQLDDADRERFIEQSIVHELLHCVLRDVMEASDLVREDLHPVTRQTWDNAFRQAEEQTVERLASALVAAMGPGE